MVADLETAVKFVEEEHGDNIANYDSLTAAGEITWDLLWALFTPNLLLYHYHELTEQHQVMRMKSIKQKRYTDNTPYWKISCDIVADDGLKFGFAKEPLPLEIPLYGGARKIVDLLLYPLRFRQDEAEIRAELIRRGKKYAGIDGPIFWESSGPAIEEIRNDRFKTMNKKITVRWRFGSNKPWLIGIRRTAAQWWTHQHFDRSTATAGSYLSCTAELIETG